MNGLLIRAPSINHILSGEKQWEIRGSSTNIRGAIALIQSGTGCISGFAELTNVIGPLTVEDMMCNSEKHREAIHDLGFVMPYQKTYAWILSNPRRLEKPIKYKHPNGAVIWVKLPPFDQQAIENSELPSSEGHFLQGSLWP